MTSVDQSEASIDAGDVAGGGRLVIHSAVCVRCWSSLTQLKASCHKW